MKRKTIKSVLAKKHSEFVAAIKNPTVAALAEKGCIITGGSIASMLMKEPIKDFDYYFKDIQTALAVVGYFLAEQGKGYKPIVMRKNHNGKFAIPVFDVSKLEPDTEVKITIEGLRNIGVDTDVDREALNAEDREKLEKEESEQDDKDKTLKVRFVSDNAISLSHRYQLIFRFWGTVEEIHANFDFVHCTCSYDTGTRTLELPPAALESILAKELTFMNSKYPLCAILRTRKFIQRGWTINAAQYVKMALILNKMNLLDPYVLEDQLTGVDSAYFMAVIRAIQEEKENNSAFILDNAYLFKVLDLVFG